ncbi:MAG TPA: hypothetical protein VE913_20345 [Longimicrobium sp.]|nr:hypothetical protein [Longimicrobium sp.]
MLAVVFAGATNTPLACTIMGLELFGAEHAAYFAVACWVALPFSGGSGIYPSQRVGGTPAGWACRRTPGFTRSGRRGIGNGARRVNRMAATHKLA